MFRCCGWSIAIFALSLGFAGCRRPWLGQWVNAKVENQTGEAVRQVEVDYPSASFGADSIGAGSALQYKFQISGTGSIKIEYSLGNGRQAHAKGPALSEGQRGTVTIRLLPEGKTQFEADLKPAS